MNGIYEGHNRKNTPREYFKVKECAREIVDAIINDKDHIALIRIHGKIVINRNNTEIVTGFNRTVIYRSRMFRQYISDFMKAYPQYEETTYRNMPAYKLRDMDVS
jgi:hypothetical protein